jgi:hypothetical protein
MEHFKFKITFVIDGVDGKDVICCFVMILLDLGFFVRFFTSSSCGGIFVSIVRGG